MAFVPMVAPTRGDSPSARAQDLGRRLKAEIEKFEAQYPGTSRKDLRDAAALALGEASPGLPARRRRVPAIAAGAFAALVALGVAMKDAAADGAPPWPILGLTVAVLVAAVVAALIKRAKE